MLNLRAGYTLVAMLLCKREVVLQLLLWLGIGILLSNTQSLGKYMYNIYYPNDREYLTYNDKLHPTRMLYIYYDCICCSKRIVLLLQWLVVITEQGLKILSHLSILKFIVIFSKYILKQVSTFGILTPNILC